MADEEMLDLESTEEQEKTNKVEKRIKDLSEKVKLTSTERDDLKASKDALELEKAAALKDVDFFKNFSTLTTKYPGSSEYQEKIREKVLSGYDVEDATISILAKEGKFTPQAQTTQSKKSPTGGSAPTTLKAGFDKPLGEMTQDEKRNLLMEREKEGDISLN